MALATVHMPAPVVQPPPMVTLELTMEEAQSLLRLVNCSGRLLRPVWRPASSGLSEFQADDEPHSCAIYRALKAAGVTYA